MVRRRFVTAVILLAGLASVYMLWARNSFLVAIDELRVQGATVQSEEIATALQGAAAEMTTLNVDTDALDAAVARFPTVESLSVETDFPQGLTVTVNERAPVGTIEIGGQTVGVSGDAHLLEGLPVDDFKLPQIEAEVVSQSGVLEGEARAQALVLGAAPEPLAELMRRSFFSEEEGVTVRLRGGVEIRFGTARRADDKWAAAAAILADPNLVSISYVDVRVPGRPAAGGSVAPEAEEDPLLPEVQETAAEETVTEPAPETGAVSGDAVTGAPTEQPVEPAPAEPAPAPEATTPAPETGAVTP